MKEYKRICPECHRELIYSSYHTLWVANNDDAKCRSCSGKETKRGEKHPMFGKHHTEESIEKMSLSKRGKKHPMFGKHHTEETIKKMRNRVPWNKGTKGVMVAWNKGIPRSKETVQKIREKCKNKIVTEETKYKLRLATINNLKKKGIVGGIRGKNFNSKACEFIDKLNKERGWNLQHALNGGEVELYGYFVDGYDKKRNIVFEYDEPYHYISERILKPRDTIRQQRIMEYIKPSMFIRYDEKQNRLYDVKTNDVSYL